MSPVHSSTKTFTCKKLHIKEPNSQAQSKFGKMNKGSGNAQNGQKNFNNKDSKQQQQPNKPKAVFGKFIKPWPESKKYLSQNGNQLSEELNKYFWGYCFKCGIAGHAAKNCRIYPSKEVILTLCSTCRSGFHDTCKNYKYTRNLSIQTNVSEKDSSDKGSAMDKDEINALIAAQIKAIVPVAPQYQQPYPYPPYWYPPLEPVKALGRRTLSDSISEIDSSEP